MARCYVYKQPTDATHFLRRWHEQERPSLMELVDPTPSPICEAQCRWSTRLKGRGVRLVAWRIGSGPVAGHIATYGAGNDCATSLGRG